MIKLKELTYYYDRQSGAALMDVTASIGPGVYLLLGENGAGKTTLLRNIAGILLPSAGECEVDGESVSMRIPSELGKVFYVGMDTRPFMRDIRSMERRHARFYPGFDAGELHDALRMFGIDASQKLGSMSLGTRHKAMLAYGMSLNTEVLLLDEPANGLDIESKQTLLKILAGKFDDRRTVIVSTHTISDMEPLYDGLMVMQGGRLRLCVSTDVINERLAFVRTTSEVPGSFYSEWKNGRMSSIVPMFIAEERELPLSQVDFGLLYSAVHGTGGQRIIEELVMTEGSDVPFKRYEEGQDGE